MTSIPTFNYKTVYFFIMSLFGVVFVFSLIGLLKVPNPMAISVVSSINVFLGIVAWILDKKCDKDFKINKRGMYPTKEEVKTYNDKKFYNLIFVTVTTFIFTMIGLGFQYTL